MNKGSFGLFIEPSDNKHIEYQWEITVSADMDGQKTMVCFDVDVTSY
jgi:hypothetical protein